MYSIIMFFNFPYEGRGNTNQSISHKTLFINEQSSWCAFDLKIGLINIWINNHLKRKSFIFYILIVFLNLTLTDMNGCYLCFFYFPVIYGIFESSKFYFTWTTINIPKHDNVG